jgi:integrase
VSKTKKKTYTARIYLGTDENGKQLWHWVGRFATAKERNEAKAQALVDLKNKGDEEAAVPTVAEYSKTYLAEYQKKNKDSSYDTARSQINWVVEKFGTRPIDSITRAEAKGWAMKQPPSRLPQIVAMFNQAKEDELIERNPFRGLSQKSKGRANEAPPTDAELGRLADACAVVGEFGRTLRAMLLFAAYTGLRPSELYALEWGDIDFKNNRIKVQRRLYRGKTALPKSNKVRTAALTPPARDALLGLPRTGRLVFPAGRGGPLSASTFTYYWKRVLVKAGLDFDFYLATKHYCVHYMWAKLDLPPRVIAQQMGWSLAAVLKLLETYGHGDIGALEEIDEAFAGAKVVELRPRLEAAQA